MKMKHLAIPAAMAASLALSTSTALAGKSDDTLTWLSNSEPDNIDMYYNTLREGLIIGRHVWDALMEIDPKTGKFRPSLGDGI